MSAASDSFETALLAHFRGTQLPLPSGNTWYVALHTADPTDAASSTEVVGGGGGAWPAYVRQAIAATSGAWTAPQAEVSGGGMVISNVAQLDFPANDGAASVTVTHFSIWDSQTSGAMWLHAPLSSYPPGKTIDPTDIFRAVAGALRVTVR